MTLGERGRGETTRPQGERLQRGSQASAFLPDLPSAARREKSASHRESLSAGTQQAQTRSHCEAVCSRCEHAVRALRAGRVAWNLGCARSCRSFAFSVCHMPWAA